MLRRVLLRAGASTRLARQVASRSLTRRVALQFMAGETLDDGLRVTAELAAAGKTVTLDHLGESVTSPDDAAAAAAAYIEALSRIGERQLPAGVSVKPSQLGLALSFEGCAELFSRIAEAAQAIGEHLTIDMEDSSVTDDTVALVQRLRAAGYADVGCAVQSYLRRTRRDVERLSALEASLRLCKGAYAEDEQVAFTNAAAIDLNFAGCANYLLTAGTYPRFATHDDRLIRYVQRAAARHGVANDRFEFQMLYGVRTDLQDELVARGYGVRVYVPYGDQWYPYYMRRLAERPANLVFAARAVGSVAAKGIRGAVGGGEPGRRL